MIDTQHRTNAWNGSPVALPDFEGTPPLPLEVNDENMTSDHVPQAPNGKHSYITGFVAVIKIFRILSQCLLRQRLFATSHEPFDRSELLQWVDSAQAEVRNVLNNLPVPLRPATNSTPGTSDGTQQANILITALCVELVLVSSVLRRTAKK